MRVGTRAISAFAVVSLFDFVFSQVVLKVFG